MRRTPKRSEEIIEYLRLNSDTGGGLVGSLLSNRLVCRPWEVGYLTLGRMIRQQDSPTCLSRLAAEISVSS